MNDSSKIVLHLSLVFLFFSIAIYPQVEKPKSKPNILIILADDMGYADISCMGGDAETPNLDSLAKEGILYTNFYNNAKCAPTRASLMTGQSPQRTGANHGAGNVTRGAMTIAEALKEEYTTLMIGKWHIKPEPLQMGFQRYFGAGLSAIHWWPTDEKQMRDIQLDGRTYTEKDMTVPMEKWYMETEHANYAMQFLQEEVVNKGTTKPFLLYYASHLPHWPLQAPRADVERYLNVYKLGTDVARQRRYDRMVALGIINPKTCSLGSINEKSKSWESLTKEEKEYYQQAMAVHTAMVYRLDQELGRLFDYLKKNKLFDNTAIFFMSDNGASAESVAATLPVGIQMGDRSTEKRINDVGAAVCNTPFRGNKSTLYEGGISTPMIVHWPKGIGTPGILSKQVGAVIDIFPTVLDLVSLHYPAEYKGRKLNPLDGQSLLPQIKKAPIAERKLSWNYEKFAVEMQGNWKALRLAPKGKEASAAWQLYDLANDRTETKDLSSTHPELLQTMVKYWEEWYQEVSKGNDSNPFEKEKKDKKEKGSRKEKAQ